MQKLFINDKVAIVTGASRGIGQAIAEMYANAGAKVVIASRKAENLQPVVESIKNQGGEVTAVPCHTGDESQVQNLVKQTVETYGGVDILVNNAATNPHFGPILTAGDSEWDKILDVNLKGYFRMVKAVHDSMTSRGGGKVINMASIAGVKPHPNMGVYCVSKAGVIMMTKVLAIELAADNIQVNAIAPGFVKTKFSSAIWSNDLGNNMVLKETPQKRMAEPQELAELALYLASPASNFMTGSVNIIDGGLSIGGFSEAYDMFR